MPKRLIGSIAALSLAAVPAISLAQGAERTTEPAQQQSELGGSSFLSIAVILATIGGAIWLVVDDDDDDPVSV